MLIYCFLLNSSKSLRAMWGPPTIVVQLISSGNSSPPPRHLNFSAQYTFLNEKLQNEHVYSMYACIYIYWYMCVCVYKVNNSFPLFLFFRSNNYSLEYILSNLFFHVLSFLLIFDYPFFKVLNYMSNKRMHSHTCIYAHIKYNSLMSSFYDIFLIEISHAVHIALQLALFS